MQGRHSQVARISSTLGGGSDFGAGVSAGDESVKELCHEEDGRTLEFGRIPFRHGFAPNTVRAGRLGSRRVNGFDLHRI